jgi:hypothetical protein
MSLRRTMTALAVVALLAGCAGTSAESSTERPAKADPVDAVMEQRLAVPEPKLQPPVGGAEFARYFIAGSLEYALRSGFTVDFRRDFNFGCGRCRSVWKRIDHEYKQGHHVEMSTVLVDAVRLRRGPQTVEEGRFERTYWLVDVAYHIDELSIRDADSEIATATDLRFADRLLVVFGMDFEIQEWISTGSDTDTPILGGRPPTA